MSNRFRSGCHFDIARRVPFSFFFEFYSKNIAKHEALNARLHAVIVTKVKHLFIHGDFEPIGNQIRESIRKNNLGYPSIENWL